MRRYIDLERARDLDDIDRAEAAYYAAKDKRMLRVLEGYDTALDDPSGWENGSSDDRGRTLRGES